MLAFICLNTFGLSKHKVTHCRCGVQLYIILAPVADRVVPCVYAFLENKSQTTYETMLRAVDDACIRQGIRPDPTLIVTDFESAMLSAIHVVFGHGVTTHGCFYHLTQSTWRKIQVCLA